MDKHAMRCYRCGKTRPLTEFISRVDDRHYRMCRSCVYEILTKRGTGRKVKLRHTSTRRVVTCVSELWATAASLGGRVARTFRRARTATGTCSRSVAVLQAIDPPPGE